VTNSHSQRRPPATQSVRERRVKCPENVERLFIVETRDTYTQRAQRMCRAFTKPSSWTTAAAATVTRRLVTSSGASMQSLVATVTNHRLLLLLLLLLLGSSIFIILQPLCECCIPPTKLMSGSEIGMAWVRPCDGFGWVRQKCFSIFKAARRQSV